MTNTPKRRLPSPPNLDWGQDGVPRETYTDDVYFSVSNGLEETRNVFFKGCGLPDAWEDKKRYTIAELGFGTGLNIAALRQLWRENKPSQTARLNVVSFEGHLMDKSDAEQALAAWPELADDVQKLLDHWPVRARGVQIIDLGEGMLLTLHQDDILSSIPQAEFAANAWFLDGFSPAKNPDMWSSQVFQHIARLSAPGAIIGTYTVAGFVRRGLADVGFNVTKRPGFGKKRERMEAIFPIKTASAPVADPLLLRAQAECPQKVVIIGAGIQGACLAHGFADYGCDVTVLEKADSINQGTSANPLGLVMPRLDAHDTPTARVCLEAYLYARSFYSKFEEGGYPVNALQFPRNTAEAERFEHLRKDPPIDSNLMEHIVSSTGEQGLKHSGSYILDPIAVRSQLLADADVRWGDEFVKTDLSGRKPQVEVKSGTKTYHIETDMVILAAGMGYGTILDAPDLLSLRGRGGQLEYINKWNDTYRAISQSHYSLQANGILVFGSTFIDCDEIPPESDMKSRSQNLAALSKIEPDVFEALNPEALKSRTGVRAATSDQLPFVGRLPDKSAYMSVFGEDLRTGRPLVKGKTPNQNGLIVVGGLGSRGFTWAPYLTQIALATAFGDPVPTQRSCQEILSPARFLMRACKRANQVS